MFSTIKLNSLCLNFFTISTALVLSSCNEAKTPASSASDTGAKQTLVSDERAGVPPGPKVAAKPEQKKIAPGLNLASITYQFRDRKFQIDDYFNLSSARTYQFVLAPTHIQIVDGKAVDFPLTEGAETKLKFRLNAMSDGANSGVAYSEVTWKVQQGRLQGSVDFFFQDLRAVQSRCNLLLEIQDGDKTFTYQGLFDPMNAGTVLLEASTAKVENLPQIQAAATIDAIKLLSDTLQAEALPETAGEEALDAVGLFSKDRANKNAAQQSLCALFYPPGFWTNLRACKRSPEAYLNLAYTDHMLKLKDAAADRVDSSNLTMTASLNFSEYESNDSSRGTTDSVSVKADIGMGIPLLKEIGLNLGIGFGYGKSWYWSESVTKGKSTSSSKGVSLSKSFVVEELHFNAAGTVKSCVWIGAKVESENKKIYSACAAPEEAKAEETYYYIYQSVQSGAIVDSSGDSADKPLVSLIRGKARFAGFLQVAQNSDFGINLKKGLPTNTQIWKDFGGKYDGLYPGLLSEFKK